MKNNQSIRHIRRTLLPAVSSLCVLLVLLAAGLMSSCADEVSVAATSPVGEPSDHAEMYLSVSVPRDFSGSGTAADRENRIETLDVLVFRRGVGTASTSYYAYAACQGELRPNGKTFEVSMPVGEDLNIHVFTNCHDALEAKGLYNCRGKEMNALLQEFTTNIDINDPDVATMPMHGFMSGVNIRITDEGSGLTIPVLRSVASVQVMTNLKQETTPSGTTLTPGEVTGEDGKKNFELRELYVYFYSESGCAGPASTSYEPKAAGDLDQTRTVKAVSLPSEHRVCDTRQNAVDYPDHPRPYSLISTEGVGTLGSLYLYENKPYSDTGFDQPDATNPTATTRLVVGGVYNGEKNPADGTPKVTYYRVDFNDTGSKLTDILRNHQYVFNIVSVGGPGYDTPDDAAMGVPINMYVEMLQWELEIDRVDFDMQNYFYSETKSIRLSRDVDLQQSIAVESDVDASQWKMSFDTENNGTATLSDDGNTLANARYRITKATDGKTLTFTPLKAYSDLTGSETREETLYLHVKNMKITYRITQTDSSPDDWGNGGELNTGLSDNIMAEGYDVLSFIIAPTDLMALPNGLGGYDYMFAPTQAYDQSKRAQCIFSWNDLIPGRAIRQTNATWNEDRDPCRKVAGGKWRTPTRDECRELIDKLKRTWATFPGATHSGVYWYTTSLPTTDDERRKTIHLVGAGYGGGGFASQGYYWTSTPGGNTSQGTFLQFKTNGTYQTVSTGGRSSQMNVRCVTEKPQEKN